MWPQFRNLISWRSCDYIMIPKMSIFNTFVEPFSNYDTTELARDQGQWHFSLTQGKLVQHHTVKFVLHKYYKFRTCAGSVRHIPMRSYLSHAAHTIWNLYTCSDSYLTQWLSSSLLDGRLPQWQGRWWNEVNHGLPCIASRTHSHGHWFPGGSSERTAGVLCLSRVQFLCVWWM